MSVPGPAGEESQKALSQLNNTLQNGEQNPRAIVHTFNPDAPPSEKAAQAGKGAELLHSVKHQAGAGETALPVAAGNESAVIPTITVEHHDDLSSSPNSNGLPAANGNGLGEGEPRPPTSPTSPTSDIPGSIPANLVPEIPDWYKIGWRAVGGVDTDPVSEAEEKDKGVLSLYLGEQFYGSWYHNAAVVIFAVFASHFLTRFGFGWGWLFIVLAFCSTYYSTSMERLRRQARDDIQRELVKTRLLSEHESAEWMNNFLDRFWLIYEPVLSRTIISSVDQILSINTPTFLDSLRLTEFTLGTKAPRIDKVRTFPKTPDDIIMMDWGISFTPNDLLDLTPRQLANKVNPKVVLTVRVGKGLASAGLPILVEDITFAGTMRVKMKLMTAFPHVQVVDMCFLEKPIIDFVLKPIGGETLGFDIANIPGLFSFIRDMTHGTLGPMMYDPNVFTLNLEQLLSGTPLDTACGVLQVTIHGARGIKGVKIGGGTPDPFVGLSIENRKELARTKYKNNTYNPNWSETKFLLVNSLSETLNLNVWDYNDHRKNQLLGSATFELNQLMDDAVHEDVVSQILKDGKDRGNLRYDVSFYPVMQAEEGSEEMDTSVGIVRLTIHQAKELDQGRSLGDINPFAKVYIDGSKPIHTTPKLKHTNNPVWESTKEFLCSDRKNCVITVKCIDDRDILKDPLVGYLSISLEHLLEAKKDSKDWFPLSGCESGKLRISAAWKPLNMAGSLHGADQYTPPIGVVRMNIQKATDVKNVEAALGGKSDPYVRVQINSTIKGRTEVINNNLNPVWDQILYIPVHSLRERVFLECMDYQHLTKDRSLGSVEFSVGDLASEDKDNQEYPYRSTGVKSAIDPLRLDKGQGFKGQLHYTAQFVPAFNLRGVKFHGSNELKETLETAGSDSEGGYVSDSASISTSSEEAQTVPTGVTIQHVSKHKQALSVDTIKTTGTANTTSTSPVESPGLGFEMDKQTLLEQHSGIIVFHIISGQLAKKARLEVLLDDAYWPAFTTIEARSTHVAWSYIGEGFIKELDFGRVWLRLNEAGEDEKDDIIAEWKGDAKAFLDSTLNQATTFQLLDDKERATSSVVIEARFVPVPIQLEPRESVNNQGTLRIELLDGHDIAAADRGGKSDPFAVFTLNGQKVFKSQTKKKTLNPDWQESFAVQVPSRVDAEFSLELFDWNQVEQAKSLGKASIDLTELEPFLARERTLELSSSKFGDKGEVRIRLLFQPEIIAKSRKNTSTFSAAGRAMTQIGGIPVGAGKGVFHGVTGAFRKIRTSDASDDEDSVPSISVQAPQPAATQDALGLGHPTAQFSPPLGGDRQPEGLETGTLKVTVMDASGLSSNDWKPYAIVRVGDKEHKTKHVGKTAAPEWNEAFKFAAGTFTPKLFVWVHDHKTLGRDKMLGTAEIDIWKHVQPGKTSTADVTAELKDGSGSIRLKLDFDSEQNPLRSTSPNSNSSDRDKSPRMPVTSPSRFSMSRRRSKTDDESG